MGFAETFGEVVGYSVYFVVGTIWLAFLGVGVCVLVFYIFTFCAQFPCWRIPFRWTLDGIKAFRKAIVNGVASASRLPQTMVKFCSDGLRSVRETMTCKCNKAQSTEILMVASRNSSDQAPLLDEGESYDEDDLPGNKIDIVVEQPPRNSVSGIADESSITAYNTPPPYSSHFT